MTKRLQEYVKYTFEELQSYISTEGSCVFKVHSNLHMSLGPYCLADFKNSLRAHILRRMVGYYDNELNGIVLDIKNIKVLSPFAAMRADDPKLHVDVDADCYIFRPEAGAILSGVVKHIGNNHLGVIIYRVFSVSIRLAIKVDRDEVKMDDTVQFRIKNFDIQNVFPYIEGDLVSDLGKTPKKKSVQIKSEPSDNTVDSGIERDTHDSNHTLDSIKKEQASDDEITKSKSKKKKDTKSIKRVRKSSESLNTAAIEIKIEPEAETKKKKSKKSVDST